VQPDTSHDEAYLKLLLKPLRQCANYKPMFGHGRKGGVTIDEFQRMYRADPFYAWIGLDSPLMYAAHKVAGGMTSVYRQVGIGGQWIFQQMLRDALGLTVEQSSWSYKMPPSGGKERKLTLDGRIEPKDVCDRAARARLTDWLKESMKKALVPAGTVRKIRGAVFEVRQGYKSKDSKRQNADIANASSAYAHLYLPVVFLFSTQIDEDISDRYATARWLMLIGTVKGASTESAYSFCREVVGYDLAAFFERNSTRIKAELEGILSTLLAPS
jgi:hypothetical protein